MRQLTPGVFHAEDTFQQSREPRLVLIGHWDLPRPDPSRPVFGWGEDELLARLIGLSRKHQRWVAVSWDGFREDITRDSRLPAPVGTLLELRERHAAGDMAEPDLTRFPVHSALVEGQGGSILLFNAFGRLVEKPDDVVQLHHCGQGKRAISLHPRALRRILRLQGT